MSPTVCYCTEAAEDFVKEVIAREVKSGSEFSKEILVAVHEHLNTSDAPIGRCYGCIDDIEDYITDFIRNGYKWS